MNTAVLKMYAVDRMDIIDNASRQGRANKQPRLLKRAWKLSVLRFL
jgi:hypothetical protein